MLVCMSKLSVDHLPVVDPSTTLGVTLLLNKKELACAKKLVEDIKRKTINPS